MSSSVYQPSPRFLHSSVQVEDNAYLWGGLTQDSSRNEVINIFDYNTESWKERSTTGIPPPGLRIGGFTLLCDNLYYFGGDDGKRVHNSLHKLQTRTLEWQGIKQANPAGGPLPKWGCGMVAYQQQLAVIGGFCHTPIGTLQSGAEFIKSTITEYGWTNEFHLFSIKEGKWSSPPTTGPRPPPCSAFTFTAINEQQAVFFGGFQPGRGKTNDVYIIDFSTMEWTKLGQPKKAHWPVGRSYHAACCLNYGDDEPVLLMTGGVSDNGKTLKDAWLLDVHSGRWRELTLPKGTQPRQGHTLTSCRMGDSRTHVTTFGGGSKFYAGTKESDVPKLADTAVLEFESVQSGDTPSSRQWVLVGVADSSQLGTLKRTQELEKMKEKRTEHGGSDKVEVKDQQTQTKLIEAEDQCMQTRTMAKQEEIKLVDLDRELSETSSWVHLGLYLGLPKHKLNEIYMDYGTQGLARCKLEMLSCILDWRGDTLSWATVVEAVSKTGNNRIAKKIADKHGVQFTATLDAISPISEEVDTELQLLKENTLAISKRLETGETQLQVCSKRELQLESDFAEAQQNHAFAQKYTDMLVEDKRMFQQKVEQREKQIEHLQSKQLEYERTIRDLEVKLASVSANLQAQQKLNDKLKHLKQQKQKLVNDIESNKSESDRVRKKKDELKQKLDMSRKETSDAEHQLKLKSGELFEAKKQVEHLKEENDKLLEQLKKQEKDTDVAIISYGMPPPAVEGCSQYENLKLSRWVEEMEEMDKALLEKDAHIQQLEREDRYTNTSRFGLRAEMEAMEEEIRKLKGKVQRQHKGSMPKDVSSQATAAMKSSMLRHPPEDKLDHLS